MCHVIRVGSPASEGQSQGEKKEQIPSSASSNHCGSTPASEQSLSKCQPGWIPENKCLLMALKPNLLLMLASPTLGLGKGF